MFNFSGSEKILPVLLIAAVSWVGYKVWHAKKAHHHGHGHSHGSAAALNEAFKETGIPPEDFQLVLEHKGRELAARSSEFLDALPLKAGFAVADIGAGTGLFMEGLAQRVGATGKVYSLEVNPSYVAFLKKRAAKLRESKTVAAEVEAVQSGQQGIPLPANSINVALIVDVYHHLEDPIGMMSTIRRALKPGGFVVVLETEWPPLDVNAQECHGGQHSHSHGHGSSNNNHNHGHSHGSQPQQHSPQQHSHAGHDHGHSHGAADSSSDTKEVMKLWHSILAKHKLENFHAKAHTHKRPSKEEIVKELKSAGFSFQQELSLLKQSFILVFVKN